MGQLWSEFELQKNKPILILPHNGAKEADIWLMRLGVTSFMELRITLLLGQISLKQGFLPAIHLNDPGLNFKSSIAQLGDIKSLYNMQF